MRDPKLKVELVTDPAPSLRNLAGQLYPQMTEAKWLANDDAAVMLDYALGRVSQRKLRLFAVACCRWLAFSLSANPVRALIDGAEQFADDLIDRQELLLLQQTASGVRYEGALRYALDNILLVGNEDASWAAHSLVRYSPWWAVAPAVPPAEIAGLLRHLAGNPFKPLPQPQLPASASRLAEALYAGEDCSFALRDALLEAGQIELAEHFQEQVHPKGCWAVDTILARHP
jgi:hypothetical protein